MGPVSGPPGWSPLVLLAGLLFLVATVCGMLSIPDTPHSALYRGICWICGSLALIALYWDHEHRHFK